MIVMKFGGSSVANAERIRAMADIVKSQLNRKPVLVLSAMGDTTDHLLDAAEKALKTGPHTVEQSLEIITDIHLCALKALGLSNSVPEDIKSLLSDLASLLAGISLIRELTGKTRDFLVSFGERLSVRIAAMYFKSIGINGQACDAWDIGFITDSNFTGAELLDECRLTVPAKIEPLLQAGILPVVTGFIAKNQAGDITTLGRGGSDLTATFIASACGAEEVQVWKDVDGIMSYDPRIVKSAKPISHVTYEEASELAYFGAQVLHPRAMLPCCKTGTPVIVKNSYNPAAPGTIISAALDSSAAPVRALTSRRNVTLVDIVSARMLGASGFLGEVFSAFARHKISVDMVATSEVSVSVTLDSSNELSLIKKELSQIASIDIKTKKAIVSIICNIEKSSWILERAFAVCAKLGVQVQMISQGASKVNISFVVNDTQAKDLVCGLHKEFFEHANTTL
ncbi:MAG: aspartate kinase [Spirochaetaceae bacterium]|jgi:aspartate kinase|nr:aspartate kinase [Spirochaetaceae bacterium]